MEAALVSVGMGVMKPLLSKLCKLLQEKRATRKCLQRDTEFLTDEMSTMSATLQILGDSEQLNAVMRIWRDNVRELSYDMEDCVDDFIAHGAYEGVGPTGLIQKIREKWKKWEPRNKAVSEIEELKTRLTEASDRHKRYVITPPTPDPNNSAQDPLPLLQALYPEQDELMGIDNPKEHIIEKLMNLQVVSIVGAGGLGKTTLANQVYSAIKDNFSCAAFVSVSRKPNMKVVLRDLAERVGIAHTTPSDDVRRLIEILRDYLKDKRYFIIIDDVWDIEAWETICYALIKNDCGSKIITTTRKKEVASSCSTGGFVYELRPLSSTDSKMLFFERAFGAEKQEYSHLQKASSEILKKCDGLPLAIITIAGMLSHRYDLHEWNRVLAAIGSALAKETGADKMTKILSLSYFDLPHHLRTCFLYLSLFPEDHIIKEDNLISRWIAEGLVEENQGRSAYEVGEGYFRELLNRSLIQPVDIKYGRAEACRVHDIVLDFITCKAADENFAASFNVEMNRNDPPHRVRRLCIHNHMFDSPAAVPTSLMFSHVRSLTLFGDFKTNCFSYFPYLRVLDMRECEPMWQDHDLEDIEKLFFLKYLDFGESYIAKLPGRIDDLQHLETLDISMTKIRELPSTITRLQRLARLRVPEHTIFPAGTIGQIKSLEELDHFTVSSSEQVKSLTEFNQLTKLRKLIVSCYIDWSADPDERNSQADNLESHLRKLISACPLHHLEVFDSVYRQDTHFALSMESWYPAAATPCRLRKLRFTCCYIDKVPNWMSSTTNLRELELGVSSIGPEDFIVLGAIHTLLGFILRTKNGQKGMILIPGGYGFRTLNYFCLTIEECGTSLLFEWGSMPKLEHLKLDISGHKMECLNGGSDFGINHLSTLTKVEIRISSVGDNQQLKDTVEQLVRAAMETLPKHPTLLFELGDRRYCVLNCLVEDMYKHRNDDPNVEMRR